MFLARATRWLAFVFILPEIPFMLLKTYFHPLAKVVNAGPSYNANTGPSHTKAQFTCSLLSIVYLDGNPLSEGENWMNIELTDEYIIPEGHHIIAIYCLGTWGPAGLLGSFDNGIVTDRSWKCTHKYHGGWYMTVFDDSRWPNARGLRTNAESTPPVAGVLMNAMWIWTDNTDAWQLFCRRRIHVERKSSFPTLRPVFVSELNNKDHALVMKRIKVYQAREMTDCFRKCLDMRGKCVSYNFHHPATGETVLNCELNDATKSDFPNYFVTRKGYIYYELGA